MPSKSSNITFANTAGTQIIYSFTKGNNNNLLFNYWDGSSWHWADQGSLPGAAKIGDDISAVTFARSGAQLIYAFGTNSNNSHLMVNYWDGSSWHWADQGLPPGAFTFGNINAITFNKGGTQLIYVFGSTGRPAFNYWDGRSWSWHWADQGLPSGVKSVVGSTAITFDKGGVQLIYVFGTADNGHLVVNYWDGTSWRWADQGLPSNATRVDQLDAITFNAGGKQYIYVFGVTDKNHLVVNYWDGSSWQWADQGLPAGAVAFGRPGAVTYASGGTQRIYVFGTANNGHLVVNYWDGSSWHWADQGLPPGPIQSLPRLPWLPASWFPRQAAATSVYYPDAITFSVGGKQNIYVFGVTDKNHLVVNYWDGSSWHWADQGVLSGTQHYRFTLNSMQIDALRSGTPFGIGEKDTDYVSFSVSVGMANVQTQTKYLGDVKQGSHNIGLTFDNIAVAQDDTAILSYTIVNKAGTPGDFEKQVQSVGQSLAEKGAEALVHGGAEALGALLGVDVDAIPGLDSALNALGKWIGDQLWGDVWSVLDPNCDGPVAVSVHPLTSAQLYAGGVSRTDDQPGVDSDFGCGGKSHYHVTWSVVDEG